MSQITDVERNAIKVHYMENRIPLIGINKFENWLNEKQIILYFRELGNTTTWRYSTGTRTFSIELLYEWFTKETSSIGSRAY